LLRPSGDRVLAQGRQVLVREGQAGERVVGGVPTTRKGAEDRWHEPCLEVDLAARPGPQAEIEGVDPRCLEIVAARVEEHRGEGREPAFGHEVHPKEAQAARFVVAVVEPAQVLGRDRPAHLAAEAQPAAEERDRLFGPGDDRREAHAEGSDGDGDEVVHLWHRCGCPFLRV
jgi:hypothetical protein